jgi:hypothetical protein
MRLFCLVPALQKHIIPAGDYPDIKHKTPYFYKKYQKSY